MERREKKGNLKILGRSSLYLPIPSFPQQGIQEGNFSTPDAENAKRLFYESTSPQARTGVEDTNSD
jgi:hypothetical protein